MKTKKLEKRFILNKKSIANLDDYLMKAVNGGVDLTDLETAFTLCNQLSCIPHKCPRPGTL